MGTDTFKTLLKRLLPGSPMGHDRFVPCAQDPLEFYGFLMPKLEALNMDASFLSRNVNEGFSGGEKKRNEILQLAVLEADVAILDEIDSGACPPAQKPQVPGVLLAKSRL